MENEFAACFPENIDFMKISLETVQNAIPDDTAVVEYFLTVDQYGQMQYEDRNEVPSVFDVYITTKKLGSCSLRRITVPGGMEIPVSYTHLDVYKRQDIYFSYAFDSSCNLYWN